MSLRAVFLILLLASRPVLALSGAEPVSEARFATEFPWLVTVINPQNDGVCGGVLIASRWVLTAAHCAGSERYVLAGSPARDMAQRLDVRKIIRHPDYSSTTGQYDVALLYLAKAHAADTLAVASDTESRLLLRNGARARLAGWGRTEHSREPANRLRAADLTLRAFARSGVVYGYQGSIGPCARDSGSPMLMQTLDGRWLLVGIARAARGMCGSGKEKGPGTAIYTDVGRVAQFIRDHAGMLPTRANAADRTDKGS